MRKTEKSNKSNIVDIQTVNWVGKRLINCGQTEKTTAMTPGSIKTTYTKEENSEIKIRKTENT